VRPSNSPVVGNAAAANPGTGTADGGGDWLAENTSTPEAKPEDGVPLTTKPRGDTHRGQAKESGRGKHRSG
jgi:hypothetical protein